MECVITFISVPHNYIVACVLISTIQGKKWKGKGYFPSFPATSPYVTAVGGTQGPESGTEEIACQSQEGGVITTGTCVKKLLV